jgi:hypothetical protein
VLDKSHAPHISGKVVDLRRSDKSTAARLQLRKVEFQIFGSAVTLMPLLTRLDINGAHTEPTAFQEVPDEVPSNEAASSTDDGCACFRHPGYGVMDRLLSMGILRRFNFL